MQSTLNHRLAEPQAASNPVKRAAITLRLNVVSPSKSSFLGDSWLVDDGAEQAVARDARQQVLMFQPRDPRGAGEPGR